MDLIFILDVYFMCVVKHQFVHCLYEFLSGVTSFLKKKIQSKLSFPLKGGDGVPKTESASRLERP